jgi:hypothetical protein
LKLFLLRDSFSIYFCSESQSKDWDLVFLAMMNAFFENPSALWALLGIAVPIWLHLYEKKSTSKVYFSDLRSFGDAEIQHKGKIEWKNLFLLLIRILLISTLVLAFAKPIVPHISSNSTSKGSYFIYLDNHPALILGKREAFLGLSKQIPNLNEEVNYLSNDFRLIEDQKFTFQKLKLNWPLILPSNQKVSSASILQHLENYSEEISTQEPKSVLWISDFPKNKPLPALDKKNKFVLLPVLGSEKVNVSVDSLWISDGFVRAKEKFTLKLRLKWHGKINSTKKITISFYLNDFLINLQKLDFLGEANKELAFQTSLPTSGEFKAHFLIDDEVPFDHKFHFILRTSEPQQVFFVGSPSESMVLEKLFRGDASFLFKNISKNQFLRGGSFGQAIFILQNLEDFTTTEIQSIQKQLKAGNSIILVPGQNSNNQTMELLAQLGVRASLNTKNIQQTYPMSQPDFTQPFFRKILLPSSLRQQVQLWNSTMIWKFPKTIHSLLSFQNRNSFLDQILVGRSKLLVFSSNILSKDHAFQKNGLFLPIMQELVLQNSTARPLYMEDNDRSFQIFPSDKRSMISAEKDLLKFNNGIMEVIPQQKWIGNHWLCQLPTSLETDGLMNGFFNVFSGNKPIAKIAINFPKTESSTEGYSVAELKNHYQNQSNVEVGEIQKYVRDQSLSLGQLSISQMLWYLAFLLFLLEMFFLLIAKRSSR